MIIDCISDLYGHYPELEGGDLLIVAGDLTKNDDYYQYEELFDFLVKLKYEKIILIPGNHDNMLMEDDEDSGYPPIIEDMRFDKLDYLCDSGTEFEGLNIWGSPWTLTFEGMNPQCKAFTVDTEEELAEKWSLIPEDTDILITHSPPYGILDQVSYGKCGEKEGKHVGSPSLIYYSRMQQPRLHVFGHIHTGYGIEVDEGITTYVNASHVNEHYNPVNKPIRIVL